MVAVFVIVHGAWGGGWEWSRVAGWLRGRGHGVFTPTLTGLGERSDIAVGDVVTMRAHIDDVIAVMELENLRDVVLCGASYGGLPVTGAADRSPERVRLVVYVDALIPAGGDCALDLLPGWFGDAVRDGLEQHGPGWRVPMPAELFARLFPDELVSERARDDYRSRLRDHPAATFVEPMNLTGAVEQLPRAFVRCTAADFDEDPIEAGATRARGEGWPYRELATGHDPQIFVPASVARILEELAAIET